MHLSITILIILFTCIVSYQGFSKYDLIDRFKHYPYREYTHREWFRILTSGFLHADWMHLLINMYVLYSFGNYIESYLVEIFHGAAGHMIFFILYLLNIILANIPTAFNQRHNPSFSSIGASGAVSGIIFIFILLNPWYILRLFFIIPVPAIILGIGYLIYSSWAANKERGRIDHSAHFAGALAGMAMIILLNHSIINTFLDKLINGFPLR